MTREQAARDFAAAHLGVVARSAAMLAIFVCGHAALAHYGVEFWPRVWCSSIFIFGANVGRRMS